MGTISNVRRLRLLLFFLLVSPTLGLGAAEQKAVVDPIAAVYRIQGVDGRQVTDGSGVLIAPGRLLTACHVTHHAKSVAVGREILQWAASPAYTDIEHDLCVLAVPGLLNAPTAAIGPTENLRLGDTVVAVGYPLGRKLRISQGQIKGLHAHDGANVLQVSAPFEHGQSGGGLFDATGRLIGIVGFKAVAGGDFHYAVPLAWAGAAIFGVAEVSHVRDSERAFWNRPQAEMPLFLRAASLEARRDWKALHGVALDWVTADANNPASWLCLARTLTKLKRDLAAADAFRHAAALLPDPPKTPVKVADAAIPSVKNDRPVRQ